MIELAGADRIEVAAGDVIGWWYGTQAGVITFDYVGIAPSLICDPDLIDDEVLFKHFTPLPQPGDKIYFTAGDGSTIGQEREYSIAAYVPEPATLFLLGPALPALAGFSRRSFHLHQKAR